MQILFRLLQLNGLPEFSGRHGAETQEIPGKGLFCMVSHLQGDLQNSLISLEEKF